MTKDLFKDYGLSVGSVPQTEIEIGKSYPIYGMITKFLSEDVGNVVVEVNFSMKLTLNVPTTDFMNKLSILKSRSLEPGIFVTTINKVVSTNEGGCAYEGICTTVIFGKKRELDA